MKKTRQLLISLLTLLCCSTGAWAQNQDGEGNYLIGSVQDWKAFATLVQTEPTANARMIADIDLGDDQTTVGTQDVPYAGTFDGNGHTLTVAYSQNIHGLAPFRYINGATIQRIHITGTIDTQTGKCAAGIVSYSTGGTTTISECWSSAKLKGDDTMGGICAVIQDGTMNINDCLVDGTISGSNAFNGGFISHPDNTATVNINNGLFLRYADADVYWSGTFFRSDQDWFGPRNLYNCYYFYPYGYPQGIQATEEQLANGETARALQAGRPEQVWVQDMDMGQPMLKVFATEQEPSGMFCYIYNHDTQTATVTYLRDSDSNKKGGTYVGDVVIPAKAPNGYDVTVIGEDAFYNCPEMTSLTIPATIDSIGCEPFAESGAQLTKITIEDGDTPIRCHVRDAWPMGCYPVFGRYVNVEELYIGRNYSSFVSRGWVEAVYEGSWSLIRDSEHLKKVTLGNVFTEVPYAMFYGCTQLQEVNINPNAKSVGKEAFSHCEALTTIDLPEGIETIDEEAFYYCKALEHIGLPKTLGVIGGNAFTNCDAFSSFTIPASVDSIGANILADCDNLKRIDIAYSSEPLKYYCPSQFQNSLRSAPIDTLYTDRYIDGALSDNRTLKKLYIGPNVTALHDYNFSDCYNIDEVFSLNPEPPTCEGSSVFYSGTKQSATLHVPVGSLDAYKEAYIWKDFFNIVDDIGSDEPCEPTLTQEKLYATRLADMGTARICHQIMPTDDGFVVFGGHTTSFVRTQSAERYNIATDSWTQMTMLYCQDYAAGIVTADGKMLLAGGMSGNGGSGASSLCELYNPDDNSFTATGSMVQARSMATATMTKSGKIYINGCWYNSSYGLECYDPETGTFSKVGDGLNANHPLLLSLRNERVAIIDGSKMVVVENGTTTNVTSELLTEYPILKGWDEAQMKYYQARDYSYIVVGKSATQAVLLSIYDDAAEGIKITKIADLPMTLPDNESVGIGYHDQGTRVFCNNAKHKVYVQTTIKDDGFSPVIIEYTYPIVSSPESGNIVVYATDKPLAKHVDNAAWTMLPDGTLLSAGGGDSNFAPHKQSFIYNLGDGSDDPDGIKELDNWTIGQSNNCQMVKSSNCQIYSLSGQRLSKPQRGLNIIDGKKIVIR
ncbi:MAG: leucine-rich repeat protein [Bacteroidaceae bacterium]|nr:leucine-rich repeat protein [Bacteroidaceae bacterium]